MTVIESAMARKPANRPTTQHLLGLPEVVLAGASGDPALESAKGILSTELGSEIGPGPGSGAEFQGRLRFSRSASFNPTMAQLLGFSLGTGIGSGIGIDIGSDIMISPCMGGANGSHSKAFHFSDKDLDRDSNRDRGIRDTDSMDRSVLADNERDMTNMECETEAGTGYWGDCGPDGSETPDYESTPTGTRDLHGSLHSPTLCSMSQLGAEEEEEEEGEEENDDEMNGERLKNKNRDRDRERDRARGRERKRERCEVGNLTSNETTSTSTESADEDEDNLICSETFF